LFTNQLIKIVSNQRTSLVLLKIFIAQYERTTPQPILYFKKTKIIYKSFNLLFFIGFL